MICMHPPPCRRCPAPTPSAAERNVIRRTAIRVCGVIPCSSLQTGGGADERNRQHRRARRGFCAAVALIGPVVRGGGSATGFGGERPGRLDSTRRRCRGTPARRAGGGG